MEDDFFHMGPETPDSELDKYINNFVNAVVDSEDVKTEQISTNKFQGSVIGLGTAPSELPLILSTFDQLNPTDYEEAEELRDFVAENYDFDVTNEILKSVLSDAVGQDLSIEEPKIKFAKSRLLNLIHEQPVGMALMPLRGVVPESSDIEINDNTFIYPTDFSYQPVFGVDQVTFKENPAAAHSIVRTSSPPDESVRIRNITEKLRQNLEIYSGTKIGSGGMIIERYAEAAKGHVSDPEDPPMEPFHLAPTDSQSVESLIDLIASHNNKQHWKSMVEVAISHLIHSIDDFHKPHESRTFAVIGLEGLYKHNVKGNGVSRDVQRYIGLLLGMASDSIEPIEVRDFIENEYSKRNQLVHGNRIEQDGMMDPLSEQEQLWDYLRASIVVFAWMDENHSELFVDGKLPLGDALIDGSTRDSLSNVLDEFSLNDHLKITI